MHLSLQDRTWNSDVAYSLLSAASVSVWQAICTSDRGFPEPRSPRSPLSHRLINQTWQCATGSAKMPRRYSPCWQKGFPLSSEREGEDVWDRWNKAYFICQFRSAMTIWAWRGSYRNYIFMINCISGIKVLYFNTILLNYWDNLLFSLLINSIKIALMAWP